MVRTVDRILFGTALLLGAISIFWMGSIFAGTNALALAVVAVIGGVYSVGVVELLQYRYATLTLSSALSQVKTAVAALDPWLDRLHPSIRNAVRLRIEGERIGLPTPVMTPYLVGLLVMLGLLGTFAGMVDTLNGAVTALEGTTELQAIREGLTAPIKGLGLAFGTSVAGVAASAMLGLMSTLSRRSRIVETRQLDSRIPKDFIEFSMVNRQRETFISLQDHTRVLPEVATKLDGLTDTLTHLGGTLIDNQEKFQASVAENYLALTQSVDRSLQQHLLQNIRRVGETVKPVVQAAMSGLGKEVQEIHGRFVQETSKALSELMITVKTELTALRDEEASRGHAAVERLTELESSFAAHMATLGQSLEKPLSQLFQTASETQLALAEVQRESVDDLKQEFSSISSSLGEQWKKTGEETGARQKEIFDSLHASLCQFALGLHTAEQTVQQEVTRLLKSSEDLIQSRMKTEEQWIEVNGGRLKNLMVTMKTELTALRDEEASRGHAAVERLTELESSFAAHMATLGQSLEKPLSQLFQTASETQLSLEDMVARIRQEWVNRTEKDNRLLEEQHRILNVLDTHTQSMSDTVGEQRDAVERLVDASRQMLEDSGQRFTDQMEGQGAQFSQIADAFAGSAAEMASLGDAFGAAVDLFHQSNGTFIENLSGIEAALDQVAARSDDQLGYYVAQAREIIDHCMLSQKEMFSELSQLRTTKELDLEVG